MRLAVLEKLLGMRQVLKLNELMDVSPKSKNLFKIQTFNGDKYKFLFVILLKKKNFEKKKWEESHYPF